MKEKSEIAIKLTILKTLLITFFCCSLSFFCNAQLAGSKWKATLNIESGFDVLFSFSGDTLQVLSYDDGSLVETMTYSYDDSGITLTKVDGQSECEPGKPAKYNLPVTGDTATFTVIEDSCDNRKYALDQIVMRKND
ncbi:hypothetical protein BH20BAC1_BH20BAC1_23810 [soil metagenome]